MLAIRLRRTGSSKRPLFRLVVTEARTARDSRSVEVLGHYNPRSKPETLVIDYARLAHWVNVGARPSDSVRTLVARHPAPPPAPAAAETAPAPRAAAATAAAAVPNVAEASPPQAAPELAEAPPPQAVLEVPEAAAPQAPADEAPAAEGAPAGEPAAPEVRES